MTKKVITTKNHVYIFNGTEPVKQFRKDVLLEESDIPEPKYSKEFAKRLKPIKQGSLSFILYGND